MYADGDGMGVVVSPTCPDDEKPAAKFLVVHRSPDARSIESRNAVISLSTSLSLVAKTS